MLATISVWNAISTYLTRIVVREDKCFKLAPALPLVNSQNVVCPSAPATGEVRA